jgi:hypothetical protein
MYLALKLGGLRFISVYLFATMFVGVLALALAYPIHPATPVGWALWFVFVLPITVSLEQTRHRAGFIRTPKDSR